MRTLDEIDPIAAITAEIEKFQKMPDRIGIMSVKSANQWVDDAMQEPDPKTYFYDLLVEGECTVLFASSNAGKSVLATQMAEAVAKENTVLYLDCELSAKQFQMRYVEGTVSPIIHRFPDTLLRAEIRPDDIVDTNLEDAILDSVAAAAEYRGIRHIFVDNITFLLNDSEKGEAAGAFMKKILALKRKYGLTMVIVGHSPKRQPRTPMVQNDLAGSAKLMNFFDAGIAIGRSAKSSELRYVKQVKVRTGLNKYDGEKVLLFKLKQEQGYTQFIYEDTVSEADHLRQKNALTEAEDFQELIDLQAQNKTVREIAAETGFAPMSIARLRRLWNSVTNLPVLFRSTMEWNRRNKFLSVKRVMTRRFSNFVNKQRRIAMSKTFNIYCDESTHLPNDGHPYMILGYVSIAANQIKIAKEQIKAIKEKHHYIGELKWTNVHEATLPMYIELIEYFFMTDIQFRAVIVDKSQIDENRPDYTFNDFYFRMYYQLLHHKTDMENSYNVYIDIKDTCSNDKLRRLEDILKWNTAIRRFQFVKSSESSFLQLADVIMGAINYNLRIEKGEIEGKVIAKRKIVDKIKAHNPFISLNRSTPLSNRKFNLFFISLK